MNEKAEQLIIDAGEKVLAYLEATEEFAVEQAPLLAQEIVAWGVWGNGLSLLIAYPVALLLTALSLRHRRATIVWEEPTMDGVLCLTYGAFAFFAFLIPTLGALPDLLKALITPRLYIIEQIGGLLG